MKKLISFIMVFFAALVLIGCTPEEGVNKLATPVIKAVENNIVYWGSVDNAVSYVVNVDDKYEQNTTDLNFDLGKVLSVSTSGVVKVKAKGNGVTFTDSDWSNEFNYEFVKDSDWLLHEAFCLYSEADKFKPYEKHHSTVREACQLAEELGVPNLLLYHTEETHLSGRKALYTAEGKEYYHGNLYVPDDLEIFEL